MKVKHPFFGEIEFNKVIEQESNCMECLHKEPCLKIQNSRDCKFSYEKLCENYSMSRSGGQYACDECIHRFTRWDKDKVLCFSCKYFKKEVKK